MATSSKSSTDSHSLGSAEIKMDDSTSSVDMGEKHHPISIDALPVDIQERIAKFVCEGFACQDALQLAETNFTQRSVVRSVLAHKLDSTALLESSVVRNRWMAVMSPELLELDLTLISRKDEAVTLLKEPKLRRVTMSDGTTLLETIAQQKSVRSLHLKCKTEEGVNVAAKILPTMELTELGLTCREMYGVCWFTKLDPKALGPLLQSVRVLHMECDCDEVVQFDRFISAFANLREVALNVQVSDNFDDLITALRKVDKVKIKNVSKDPAEVIAFAKRVGNPVTAIDTRQCSGHLTSAAVDLSDIPYVLPHLEEIWLPLQDGAEDEVPSYYQKLNSLHLFWNPERERNRQSYMEPYYAPPRGRILQKIRCIPSLTSLGLGRVSIAMAELVEILKSVGSRLEQFVTSLDRQDEEPDERADERLLRLMNSMRRYTPNLRKFEIYPLYNDDGDRMVGQPNPRISVERKKQLLMSLDQLHLHVPSLFIADLENMILEWSELDSIKALHWWSDSAEIEKRRLRASINGRGMPSSMCALAAILEEDHDDSPADVEEAMKWYCRAHDEGNDARALFNIVRLTRNGYGLIAANANEADAVFQKGLDRLEESSDFLELGVLFEKGDEHRDAMPFLATRVYERAVEKCNSTRAMYSLGRMLEEGYEGHPPQLTRAVDLLERAANGGRSKAMHRLGDILLKGYDDVPPNPARARTYFERAIAKGCDDSMNNLGVLLEKGYEGVEADPSRAAELYRKAIEIGHSTTTMCNLARLLEKGYEGHPPDATEAVRFYKLAMEESDDIDAIWNLSRHVRRGYGEVPGDSEYANELVERAIKSGSDAYGMYDVACQLESGYDDQPPDPRAAAFLYQRAIDVGSIPAAMYDLGYLIERGYEDVPADAEKAIALYERAIEEHDDSMAMHYLAITLEEGCGNVGADPAAAAELYRRAASKNEVCSMIYLGALIEEGYEGVEANRREALELFAKAVEFGKDLWCGPLAMRRYGHIIERGYDEVPGNPREALEWYSKAVACDEGSKSLFRMACVVEKGFEDAEGKLEGDVTQAVDLLWEAVKKDDFAEACFKLGELVESGYGDVAGNVESAEELYEQGSLILWHDLCVT